MKCNNCNSTLSCGCQRQTARDGKSCCNKCVSTYNKTITKSSAIQKANNINSGITGVSASFIMI